MSLLQLAADIDACKACPLFETTQHRCHWSGNVQPGVEILFVGEAPGPTEAITGPTPFIGKAGQLLHRWIDEEFKLPPGSYALTNAARCWPWEPSEAGGRKTRKPTNEEFAACRPFLLRFLDAVRPQVVVAVGRNAERALKAAGVPCVYLKHPSYFIRYGKDWSIEVQSFARQLQALRRQPPLPLAEMEADSARAPA